MNSLFFGSFLVAMSTVVVRYHRSRGLERDRMRWLLWAVIVMVAFVAEFSRGKSELINAVFFAGYKRRIMPASAGRTTSAP